MYGTTGLISSLLGAYHMADVSMRYSRFMPRVYNLAISLGFEPGKIMPSRAFCSDESQGYPIILIAKHFGSFPFNHGLVVALLLQTDMLHMRIMEKISSLFKPVM